jgi:hypothetical protein
MVFYMYPMIWEQLGVWMQDEQPTSALMHFKKFVESDPRHPNVRSAIYIMGRIYDRCN